MIFGDEPRFHKDIVHHNSGAIAGFKSSETDQHVGPGSYFAAQNEESRSGWQSRSFSKRQPMSPETRPVERSFHYTSGVIVPTGLALPGSPVSRQTPGPGYYGKPTSSPLDSVRKHRPSSADSAATRTSYMGSSMRLAPPTCVIKDGVLFSSISQNIGVGPGHYAVPDDHLLKKSHNVRVNSASKGSPRRKSSAPTSPAQTLFASPRTRPTKQDIQSKVRGNP